MSTTEQSISRSRTRLLLRHPWWTSLIMRLEVCVLTDDEMAALCGCFALAATDGHYMFFAGESVQRLTPDQLDGLVLHEALHIGFGHHARIGSRDFNKWNRATDYSINGIIVEDGLTLLPDSLYNEDYLGMSAEDIYPLLPDEKGSPCPWGIVVPGDGDNVDECNADLVEALHRAVQAGRLQSVADRILKDITQQDDVPWQNLVVQQALSLTQQDDYTWRRANRRGLATDVILPTTVGSSLQSVVFIVDTSASLSDKDLEDAVGRIQKGVGQLRPLEYYVIMCDNEVRSVQKYKQSDSINIKSAKGGGGTDFRPALALARTYRPSAVIYFTDLYGDFGDDPRLPIIWITETRDHQAPFGKTIVINTNNTR